MLSVVRNVCLIMQHPIRFSLFFYAFFFEYTCINEHFSYAVTYNNAFVICLFAGRTRTWWIQLRCQIVCFLFLHKILFDFMGLLDNYLEILVCYLIILISMDKAFQYDEEFVPPCGGRRRESTDVEDMFIAHVSGMDTLARGLRNVAKLIEVDSRIFYLQLPSFSEC